MLELADEIEDMEVLHLACESGMPKYRELAMQLKRPESEELDKQLKEQGLRRLLEQDELLDLAEQLDEPMLLIRLKSLEHLVWQAVKKRSPALATLPPLTTIAALETSGAGKVVLTNRGFYPREADQYLR